MIRWHLELGEEVLHVPTGRIGRTTQVRLREAWVRFPGRDKSSQLDRADLIAVRTLRALAEVDEDERNAAEYRRSTKGHAA